MSESDSEPRPWDSAWAVSPAGAKWRAANPPPLSDLGELRVRRTFSHLGITLDPPPDKATPNLDATAARNAYTQMLQSPEFRHPLSWVQATLGGVDALLLPGGHRTSIVEQLRPAASGSWTIG